MHLIFTYRLYTLSHIPQLSIFIIANGTSTKRGENSLFTELTRCAPSESSRIQESSQSSLSIKCWPANYLPSCLVMLMTNVPNRINVTAWHYHSVDQWWWKWGQPRLHLIIRHRWRWFGSPPRGPTSRLGVLGEVVINYNSSSAKETEQCQYCPCMPSASTFPKSSCGNRTTTAQLLKVNPP